MKKIQCLLVCFVSFFVPSFVCLDRQICCLKVKIKRSNFVVLYNEVFNNMLNIDKCNIMHIH